MICSIAGKIKQRKENSLLVQVNGFGYEVFIPQGIMKCLSQDETECELVTFHYHQADQNKSIPILIGFMNEIEKEFFEKFITVSGIGPKAAVKAIAEPIPDIAKAIDCADIAYLKSLPGIGMQRAREIVAKLQGKVGKFGLIRGVVHKEKAASAESDIEQEALAVLLQLQYKKPEAQMMIKNAITRNPDIKNSEELLNEVYKQRSNQ
ncbi:MAG: helix-hairpin-helix domain-containing protein [Candidatus Omnitrophica bacterium]|nr:helix-hairpin-helix domain-containing protein [Candidatus Omnitrophota bacterium]